MYRKTGSDSYYTSAENRYGYKSASLRMSERERHQDQGRSSEHGSENKQDRARFTERDRDRDPYCDRDRHSDRDQEGRGRERDVYIRSRTFQNVSYNHSNATKSVKVSWNLSSTCLFSFRATGGHQMLGKINPKAVSKLCTEKNQLIALCPTFASRRSLTTPLLCKVIFLTSFPSSFPFTCMLQISSIKIELQLEKLLPCCSC